MVQPQAHRLSWPERFAALALFGTAMALSQGVKSPLDYSVFSASAAAVLLAARLRERRRSHPSRE